MSEPLKVGIIGCAQNTHGRVWAELLARPEGVVFGMKPVKVWDASPEAAQTLAEAIGAEVVRHPAMTGEGTDGVIVAELMPFRYLELVRPLLEKGLRVFLNRPFAGSVEDAGAIIRLAQKHGARIYSASALYHTRAAATAKDELRRVHPLRLFNLTGPSDHLTFYLPHGIAALVSVLGTGVSTVRTVAMPMDARDPHKVTGPVVVCVRYDETSPVGPACGTIQMIGPAASWYGFSLNMFGAHGEAQTTHFDVTYEHLLHTMAKFFQTGEEPIPRDVVLEKTCIYYAALTSARKDGAPVNVQRLIKSALS